MKQIQMFPSADGIVQVFDGYGPAVLEAATTVALFLVSFAVIYWLGKRVLVGLAGRSLESRGFAEGLVGLTKSVVGLVVLVGSLGLAATIAGFGTVLVAFSALAGALVLAVGFAAQDLISNFIAGVFIVKDEPFEVGDPVEWNGNTGTVREIQLRVTKLDTVDNELVTVPNSELANSVLVNPSGNEQLRVSYDFGIDYDGDIARAKDVIADEAGRVAGALSDPMPSVAVTDLGDSAVVLSGRFWVDPREHTPAGAQAAFIEAVKERFDAEGIVMPYPHSELTGELSVTDTVDQPDAKFV